MRRLFGCVFLVFLAGLPAASSEELGIGFDTIDWAIHPSMKGKEREILRAVLQVVFEECPALGRVDWGAAMTREGRFKKARFSAAKLYTTNAEDITTAEEILASPYIEGWEHHGRLDLTRKSEPRIDWGIDFSWEEPPGIATHMFDFDYGDHLESWTRRSCNYDEVRITNFADFDERLYWFKRVDRLAEVVKEVEARYAE